MTSPSPLFNFRNPFVPASPAVPPPATADKPSLGVVDSNRRPVVKSKSRSAQLNAQSQSSPVKAKTQVQQLVPQRWRNCLLACSLVCFLAGHGRHLLQWLWQCLIGGNAADILALLCLVAFFESAISNCMRAAKAAVAPFLDFILNLPEMAAIMSDQMTAMLEEIQVMRNDVKAMKAKTNWLPGGMVA